ILEVTELPESTYHYHLSKKNKPNPDKGLEELIQEIFEENKERYGYRRITDELKARGYQVNHKRVLRSMRKLGIKSTYFSHKTRRYNYYKGTVGKIAKTNINRRYMTPNPLQKLVIDVTEFKCLKYEKLYLSLIMDLYNSEVISWKIFKKP